MLNSSINGGQASFINGIGGSGGDGGAPTPAILTGPTWTDNNDGTATVAFTTDIDATGGIDYGASAGTYTASSMVFVATTTFSLTVPEDLGTEFGLWYWRIYLETAGGFAGYVGSENDDTIAPVLSSAADGTPTTTGATDALVTTNADSGTLYWCLVTNGGSATNAQIIAGTGGNIVAGTDDSQAVTVTGVQTFDVVGAAASTAYQIKTLHVVSGAQSNQGSVNLTTASSVDPDAQAVIDEMDVVGDPPDSARQILINNLVVSLKSAGVWTVLDGLYILAAHAEASSMINWVNPGAEALVENGTLTFTVDEGWTGDSNLSNYLTVTGGINLDQFTNNQYQLDSAHIAAWSNTNANNMLAGSNGSYGAFIKANTNGGEVAINSGASDSWATGAAATGLFIGNRANNTQVTVTRNGAAVTGSPFSEASTSIPGNDASALRVSGDASSAQIMVWAVGGSIAGMESDYYNALNAYISAL